MTNVYNENAPTFATGTSSSTLSAFFDSRSDAESAVQQLKDAGIPSDSVRLVPGYESDSEKSAAATDERGGFWHTLESFLSPTTTARPTQKACVAAASWYP